MSRCVVKGCLNTINKLKNWKKALCIEHGCENGSELCSCKPPFRLFAFPTSKKNKEAQARWAQAVNLSEDDDGASNYQMRVCSDHFVDGEPTLSHPDPEINLGFNIDSPVEKRGRKRKKYNQKKESKIYEPFYIESNDFHSLFEPLNESKVPPRLSKKLSATKSKEQNNQCPKCMARFNNPRGLTDHMVAHETQLRSDESNMSNSGYNCKSCNIIFPYQNDFIKHFEKSKFQCHICKERIPCMTLYASHVNSRHENEAVCLPGKVTVSCSICSLPFCSVAQWRYHERKRACGICKLDQKCLLEHSSHLASHVDETNVRDIVNGGSKVELTCKLCQETFAMPGDFYQHTKGLFCHISYCDQGFQCSDIEAYYDHVIDHVQDTKLTEDEVTIPSNENMCRFCEWRFPTAFLLDSHKRKNNLSCHICNETLPCLLSLSRHLKTHRDLTVHEVGDLVCKQCNNKFISKADFVQHTKGHKCICHVVFPCFMGVSEHLRLHVTSNLPYKPKTKANKDTRLVCVNCQKNFLTPHLFAVHKKGYQCHICSAMFPCSGYEMFSNHVLSHVSTRFDPPKMIQKIDENNHYCDFCGWTFPTSFHLKKHTERKEMCYICYQLLPCLLTLSLHLLSHVNTDEIEGKLSQFICKHCDSIFEDRERLFTHTTTHKCHLCRTRFPCFVDMAYHIRCHVTELSEPFNRIGIENDGLNEDLNGTLDHDENALIWCEFCKLGFIDSETFGAHKCDKEDQGSVFDDLMVN